MKLITSSSGSLKMDKIKKININSSCLILLVVLLVEVQQVVSFEVHPNQNPFFGI